ncbi:MAG: ATP-dependent DNA helicase RecG [Phycisphaerae bacterium]|nr:ATP-dependent DNA helicase RecG [Phycisphaerae bacterium]
MPDPAPISLTSPLASIKGIGQRTADQLAALGLTNVGKLIAHIPLRHERHEAEANVRELLPGQIVSTRGEIVATRPTGSGRRARFEAVLMDPTGRLDLVWFNAPYMRDKVIPGMRVRVHGKAKSFGYGLQLTNPKLEPLRPEHAEPDRKDARIRPVYPASEEIDSPRIERAIDAVLSDALPQLEDHLPAEYRAARDLPELRDAYRMLHRPESMDEAARAVRRLAYDELLMLQVSVALKRAELRTRLRAPALPWSEKLDSHIRARFPFTLTDAQDEVIKEITADLSSPVPSNRLIQGDVGSGKTVVALYAMLLAVADAHQAALMAPTELLAEQHFASISRMLTGSRVRVALLTASITGDAREDLLLALRQGRIDLLIGTHALLTDQVEFKSLAVAVIDEQHRFGVHQRAALRSKGATSQGGPANVTPHVLVMTATPIPRTLAITIFGDLDVSTIRALPAGRKPIRSRVVQSPQRDEVYAFVDKRLEKGQQAYVVVPAIDAGEDASGADIRGVTDVLEQLTKGPLKSRRVEAVHGRLSQRERERIMQSFRDAKVDVLVATTVIEVGVDVPNAAMMVIEQADRFGLSQLHQLRGRVGRGAHESVCILIADPTTEEARARLAAIAATTDGFALAEKDFELRGMGELFGSRQSGAPAFRVVDLVRDRDLLAMARRDAMDLVAHSPTLDRPEESLLKRRVLKAHGQGLALGDVG